MAFGKLSLLGLLVLIAACSASVPKGGINRCETFGGSEILTFGGAREYIKVPCKYNAIRDTRCGKYKVTLTPGNELNDNGGRFLLDTLWIRVKDLADNLQWEGRTDYNITNKWSKSNRQDSYPFNKKDGALEFYDVFGEVKHTAGGPLKVNSKKRGFKIEFFLYDPLIPKSYRNSGFAFTCVAKNFKPKGYPSQICGNGTAKELRKHVKMTGYDKATTIIRNIFSDFSIEQTDSDCRSAARQMSKQCKGREYLASKICGPIFFNKKLRKCIKKQGSSVRSAFRHCVETVCDTRNNPDSCTMLKTETGKCGRRLRAAELEGCVVTKTMA